MNFAKTLVFEVAAEWGHFRTFNTTSSPLTYPIPPRPALIGLVGAILGIERETQAGSKKDAPVLAEVLSPSKVRFAVQLLHPVKKQTVVFNLLDTKNFKTHYNIKNRTQVPFELLKEPRFRIFAVFQDASLQDELTQRLQQKAYHFQPYLGLSQFTADVTYRDTVALKPVTTTEKAESMPIQTAINLSRLTQTNAPIQFDQEYRYAADVYPFALSPDRVVQEYAEILVETSASRAVMAQLPEVWESDYGNISFL